MERNCNICNNIYKAPNKQSMFCSDPCKKKGRNSRLRRQNAEKLKIIKCITCGKEFKQKKINNTHFCNKKCKEKHKGDEAKKEGKTTKKKLKALITKSRKSQGKCANCNETDIRLFEFAHYSRKEKTILSVSQHQCLSYVIEELKKGRWLCVWCHRKETMDENKLLFTKVTPSTIKRKKNMKYINDIKLRLGQCETCNIKVTDETFSFFEFDHIDPSTKTGTISQMHWCKKEIINNEIAKCRLLCCKCHRLHTINQAILKYSSTMS